ncbi:hypothetical protein [Yoonia vestfoldensis]|uniref:hypothetical protein n=1 Tax=Yoonia vestfoldensis TaxID=245188 RepID=UPI00036202D8|nr:hypothetical protein [Yoonia vestfoldensis]
MTISLPGSSKGGLARLLGRKKEADTPTLAQKPLGRHEVAKLFKNKPGAAPANVVKPAKLNETEKQDVARLSNLRGALYSKD